MLLASCGRDESDRVGDAVRRLSSMSELGTVEYTVRKVIKADDSVWYKYGQRKILFTGTAYLKAGIDMRGFGPENVRISDDATGVTIILPAAKLLSFNMPPEQIRQEFSGVTGLRQAFTPEEKNAIQVQAEKEILAEIPNLGILSDAEDNARLLFITMFSELGYQNVTVKFEGK